MSRPTARYRCYGRANPASAACTTATTAATGRTGHGPTGRLVVGHPQRRGDNVQQLGQATVEAFQQHPDYQIITSFPGLADLSGARVLAEIGDDRARLTDARALKAYAGSAPVTRASGRGISITRRIVKNDRLNALGFLWAMANLPRGGPARDHCVRPLHELYVSGAGDGVSSGPSIAVRQSVRALPVVLLHFVPGSGRSIMLISPSAAVPWPLLADQVRQCLRRSISVDSRCVPLRTLFRPSDLRLYPDSMNCS